MPCPECGASVQRSEASEHECEPERRLDYELFQLKAEIEAFDGDLAVFLASPQGLFARFLAERDRGAS
jgi:hypothetical protein